MLPYTELSGFSPLFQTYVSDFEGLAEYFAGNPASTTDLKAVAGCVVAHPRNHRHMLVEALQRQAVAYGADEASRRNIDLLLKPDTLTVVTGQQLGLGGGPLYTLFKTITTIQLAHSLSRQTGKAVVPVFWLEGEDHDLPEAGYLALPTSAGVEKVAYTGHTLPEKGNLGPVGQIVFNEQINEVLAQVESLLAPTDFRAELMALLRTVYWPGTTFGLAFAQFITKLFPDSGLVLIAPNDPLLKQASLPLFQKAIQEQKPLFEALTTTSESLQAAGFHAQVTPRPLNLFYVYEGARYAIEPDEVGYRLKGHNKTFSEPELLAALEDTPTSFSPNVVLRPQMQDWLLPTVAYVGGPGEVAYFAQFKKVYEWSGIPMPIVYPRASATLMEGRIRKIIDKNQLHWPDLAGDFESFFQQLVRESSGGKTDAVFNQMIQKVYTELDHLKPYALVHDGSLDRAVEATRTNLTNELEKLRKRVLQAEKRNHDTLRDQAWKAKLALFPANLQERSVSFLYFLNKYGIELIARLTNELTLETHAHQVVAL